MLISCSLPAFSKQPGTETYANCDKIAHSAPKLEPKLKAKSIVRFSAACAHESQTSRHTASAIASVAYAWGLLRVTKPWWRQLMEACFVLLQTLGFHRELCLELRQVIHLALALGRPL